MSVLDTPNPLLLPIPELAANHLRQQARMTFQTMARAFNDGAVMFWQNPKGATPEEIATALGSDAKEIFELHWALGELLHKIKPDSVSNGMAVLGQFQLNDDGTVTIVPQPEENAG
jgi:hypothetical protein